MSEVLKLTSFLKIVLLVFMIGLVEPQAVIEVTLNDDAELPCAGTDPASITQITWEFGGSSVGVYTVGGSPEWNPTPEWMDRTNVYNTSGTLYLIVTTPTDEGRYTCTKFDGFFPGTRGFTDLELYSNVSNAVIEISGNGNTKYFYESDECVDITGYQNNSTVNISCSVWSYPDAIINWSGCGNTEQQICETSDNGTKCHKELPTDVIIEANHTCEISYSFQPAEISVNISLCTIGNYGEGGGQQGTYSACLETEFPVCISMFVISIVISGVAIFVIVSDVSQSAAIGLVVFDWVLVIIGVVFFAKCEGWRSDEDIPPMGNAAIAMFVIAAVLLLISTGCLALYLMKKKKNDDYSNKPVTKDIVVELQPTSSPTSLSVKWSASTFSKIPDCEVSWCETDDKIPKWESIIIRNECQTTIKNLKSNTTYNVRVRTTSTNHVGEFSKIIRGRTQPAVAGQKKENADASIDMSDIPARDY